MSIKTLLQRLNASLKGVNASNTTSLGLSEELTESPQADVLASALEASLARTRIHLSNALSAQRELKLAVKAFQEAAGPMVLTLDQAAEMVSAMQPGGVKKLVDELNTNLNHIPFAATVGPVIVNDAGQWSEVNQSTGERTPGTPAQRFAALSGNITIPDRDIQLTLFGEPANGRVLQERTVEGMVQVRWQDPTDHSSEMPWVTVRPDRS